MINKLIFSLFLIFLFSCNNIELVLNEEDKTNRIKNKTSIIFSGTKQEKFNREILSSFGNNNDGEFILITTFSEKKENRLVKKNQVAEKVDYQLTAMYDLFYKDQSCKIYKTNVVTKFSFVPKSFGYNFGTTRSLEKLYKNSVKKNIGDFIKSIPKKNNCL